MHKATVLAVDDDENLQLVMRTYLENQGYQLLTASNGAETMAKLETTQPDIILLDLMLPDNDGLTLLMSIRAKTRAPVIVVSGKDETADKIVGLEMGADDYLTKPFEMRELSARIKAVLRRAAADEKTPTNDKDQPLAKSKRIAFNGWLLDRQQYQLFDEKHAASDLTTGEFRLLEALVMAPNRVLSREQLFELTRAGGKFDAYDRVIDTQVARIRKKLNDDPAAPALIKTVRGVGYMFCGDAKSID
ncbi:MAG TPA: response regulator transcription factor [Patescibacteria group bacterium]|nr:response regulator transcription factor [Patescibacteria group bacterium]